MIRYAVQNDIIIASQVLLLVYVNSLEFSSLEMSFPFAPAPSELVKNLTLQGADGIELGLIRRDEINEKFLFKGQTQVFYILVESMGYPLHVTVTPCATKIKWNLRFRDQNNTGRLNDPLYPEDMLKSYEGQSIQSFNTDEAQQGLYTIEITSLDGSSYVELYFTLNTGELQVLQELSEGMIRFRNRKNRNKVTAKWKPSTEPNSGIKYCVIVNKRKYYNSVCDARIEYDHPIWHLPYPSLRFLHIPSTHTDVLIKCVGNHTSFTMEMEIGTKYYFNVFAVDGTDLSISYARGEILYQKFKPIGLKDGQLAGGNIKINDGRLSFRYKVRRKREPNFGNAISWHVLPCGGLVWVEVQHRKRTIIEKHLVIGYKKIIVNDVIPGERYVLKITATRGQLRYIKGVEVMATMNLNNKLFPPVPGNVELKKYEENCSSVTIEWVPVEQVSPMLYCIYVREYNYEIYNQIAFSSIFKNQCFSNQQMRNSKLRENSIQSQCIEVRNSQLLNRDKMMRHVINDLETDQAYIVQVTVSRPRGNTLSYNLLQIYGNRCS